MKPLDVILYVFDGLADWEAGYVTAGINDPESQKEPGRYHVKTVALGAKPVLTMGGLRILPDGALENLTPEGCAMLILPGGEAWNQGQNTEAIAVAARCLQAGIPVAAICGATAGLARGGLLDTRRHTSNAREYLAGTGYLGGALYEEAAAVSDGDVITAPGTMPVDFAYEIFKRLDIYTLPVLEAWHGLFKTGRVEYFYALMQALK